jgi:ribosomal-protein-alanine N-acetyltransferase
MSPRVVLPTPARSDEEGFIARMRASRRLDRPWLYPPLTRDSYRAYLERIAGDRHRGFLARRPEDSAMVGWFNVSEIVRGPFQSA